MKLVSWNVNGLRAVNERRDLAWAFAGDSAADVVCLQETKIQPDAVKGETKSPPGYARSWWSHHATKKGYSGTAIFVRDGVKAEAFDFKIGGADHPEFDAEGRVCAVDVGDFVVINVYCPNGGSSDERLVFKHEWHEAFLVALQKLKQTRAIVICGDFNIAHTEIDVAKPEVWCRQTGFLPIERQWFDQLLAAGFLDSFRFEKGPLPRNYTYWETRVEARKDNLGWRIDYFVVDKKLEEQIADAWISPQIRGSDHCPVGVELRLQGEEEAVVEEVVEEESEDDDDGASRWRR